MTDLTPEALDEWRTHEAHRLGREKAIPGAVLAPPLAVAFDHYRKLVREDVQPPAEPIGNDLPKWAHDEAERLARAESPKWGVHDSPRSHYALARLIAKQGKPEAAEPDQDVIDTQSILRAWSDNPAWDYSIAERHQGDKFACTVGTIVAIKDRVRREAIKEYIAAEQKRRLRMQQAPAMGRDVGWI